jgi:hypothetical protein
MESKEGKLLTDDDDILKEAVRHYKAVFAHKNITPGLEHIKSSVNSYVRSV